MGVNIYKKAPAQPSAQGETLAVPASPKRVTHYEPGSYLREKKGGKECKASKSFLSGVTTLQVSGKVRCASVNGCGEAKMGEKTPTVGRGGKQPTRGKMN